MPRQGTRSTNISAPRRSAALTRERVLREGLDLLDREGIAALNMRRLAARLGVTPMALYNHVRDKDDLLQGVAGLVVDNVRYGTRRGDWREQLRACFRALRNACLAHPGIVHAVETAKVLPASVFRPMEIALAALARAGLAPDDALRAWCLLIGFTMGQIGYEVRGPYPSVDPASASRRGQLPAGAFPAASGVVAALGARDFDLDAAFEFGLTTILAGLERGSASRFASPVTSPAAPRSRGSRRRRLRS